MNLFGHKYYNCCSNLLKISFAIEKNKGKENTITNFKPNQSFWSQLFNLLRVS